MDFIAFVIIGILVGTTYQRILEVRSFGLFGDLASSVIGGLVGGYFFDAFGITDYGFGGALVMSIVGASLFLFVEHLFTRTQKTTFQRRF